MLSVMKRHQVSLAGAVGYGLDMDGRTVVVKVDVRSAKEWRICCWTHSLHSVA